MKDAPIRAGSLRVWHIPQIPGEPFRVPVKSPEEAALILATLADYDVFQLDHNIKPDFANAQGLEVYEDGEWCEWQDEHGNEIGEVSETMLDARWP